MSLRFAYREEVPNELNEAAKWYEDRQDGLGERFLTSVQNALDQIAENPQMYAVLYRNVRAAPMRDFPYVIYYRAEAERVVVIAIQHGSRHSRNWRRRL